MPLRVVASGAAESPEQIDALVLEGRIALARGDVDAARDLAHAGLQVSRPARPRFGSSSRSRPAPAGSRPWWRFNSALNVLGDQRSAMLLTGAYLTQRVATQATRDLGLTTLHGLVSTLWLGLVAYTWWRQWCTGACWRRSWRR